MYYNRTFELLQNVHVPSQLLLDKCNSFRCTHWACINDYYSCIVSALRRAMDELLFIYLNRILYIELDELKQPSINVHNLKM